jgi:NADH:ubiquinone oxidoreductase subunit K
VQRRPEDEGAPSLVSPPEAPASPATVADPEPPAPGAERTTDTAASPVIRAESVSIPTPAWGTALAVDDAETVVAELVDEDGLADEDGAARATPTTATGGIPIPDPAPPRPAVLGWLAMLLAVATAVLHGVAVSQATEHASASATVLAWIAIGCSIAAVALGILAAAIRSGRTVGITAAVIGLFANPWVLLQILTLFGR